jgi:hypothetical protein
VDSVYVCLFFLICDVKWIFDLLLIELCEYGFALTLVVEFINYIQIPVPGILSGLMSNLHKLNIFYLVWHNSKHWYQINTNAHLKWLWLVTSTLSQEIWYQAFLKSCPFLISLIDRKTWTNNLLSLNYMKSPCKLIEEFVSPLLFCCFSWFIHIFLSHAWTLIHSCIRAFKIWAVFPTMFY